MGVCRKCGSKILPGLRSCPACGAVTGLSDKQPAQEKFSFGGMADSLGQFDSADIAQNKAMAAFAYFGIMNAISGKAAKFPVIGKIRLLR